MGRKNRRASAAKTPAAAKGTGDNGQRLIDLALDKLNRGHDKEAASLLKRAIRGNPKDPTTQMLMGLALCRQNKAHEALAFLHRAAGLAPDAPEVHFHLANAHVLCGEGDAAANAYARALALKPDFADAYRELGLLMISSGLKDQAGECLGLAVQYNPQDALACFNLGILEKDRGNPQAALELYARAASIDPALIGPHVNMGNIAMDFGKTEQAERCYRRAIEIDPGFAIAYANLGRALRNQDDFEGSEEVCRKAVALDPNDGVVWYNYGDALHQLFRYPDAAEAYQNALALRPDLAVACNNYGLVLTEMGRRDEAVEMFTRAVELAPEHSGYKCSLSQSLLSMGRKKLVDMGRLAEAYEMADHCFVCGLRQPNRQFGKIPRWRGEDLTGKRLLIWREQGVGDEVRLSQRYPQAIEAAGHCIVEAEERLAGLIQRSYPGAEIVPVEPEYDETRDDADYQVPAGGLEEFFEEGFVEYNGGGEVLPFIAIEPDRQAIWKERLAALGPGLKIGICWRSSLSGRLRDPFYCELSDWADLLRLDGVQFVNLQYDDCEEELREAEAAFGVTIHRWEGVDLKDDLEEVFALTSGLDLVITAGTAVAEIATARAVPVWCYLVGSASPGYKPRPTRNALAINWLRHIDETWQDILGRMARYLEEEVMNQQEPMADREALRKALMMNADALGFRPPEANKVPSADLCDLIPNLEECQGLVLPGTAVSVPTATINIFGAYEVMTLAVITRHYAPKQVVEFGTGRGQSAYIFAANGPDTGKIFTIDLDKSGAGSAPEPGVLFRTSEYAKKITQLLRKDSEELPDAIEGLQGKTDLVLLHGNPSYEGYRADCEAAARLVSPNGAVLFRYFGHSESSRKHPAVAVLNELAAAGEWTLRHVLGTDLVIGRRSWPDAPPGEVFDFAKGSGICAEGTMLIRDAVVAPN